MVQRSVTYQYQEFLGLDLRPPALTDVPLRIYGPGDTEPRAVFEDDRLGFGPGGAGVIDTVLSRGAANRLDLAAGDSFAVDEILLDQANRDVSLSRLAANIAGLAAGDSFAVDTLLLDSANRDVGLDRPGADRLRVLNGDSLEFGNTPAQSGLIRLPNAQWITGRNAAGLADVNIIQLSAADLVAFGAALAGFTMGGDLDMSTNIITNIGAAGTDFVAGGGLTLAAILTVSAGGINTTGGVGNAVAPTANELTAWEALHGAAAVTSLVLASHITGAAPLQRDVVLRTGNAVNPQALVDRLLFGSNAAQGSSLITSYEPLAVLGASNPASAGAIRLPNAQWIAGRNAANGADVNMIRVDATDLVAFGAALAASTMGGNLDLNGNRLVIDTDADTFIEESADDAIHWEIGPAAGRGLTLGLTGLPDPDSLLHIWAASAGVIASAGGSLITLEGNNNTYVSILVPNNREAGLILGDPDLSTAAYLAYQHGIPQWKIGMEGGDHLYYSAGAFAFQEATIISTTAGALTLNPTTDVLIANGKGLIIGYTAALSLGVDIPEVQALGTTGDDSAIALGRFAISASGPAFYFTKSRNNTIGNHTIVQDNDQIGSFVWNPDDGVDFGTIAAWFRAEVDDATPAAGDIGMAYVWEQMPGAGGALRETMRLDAAGLLTLAVNGLTFTVASTIATTAGDLTLNATTDLVLQRGGTEVTRLHNAGGITFGSVADDPGTGVVSNQVSGGVAEYRLTTYRDSANASAIVAQSARGTSGVPAASQLDDILFRFLGQGYGTAFGTGGAIRIIAAELWTATAHGTKIEFQTTDNTTIVNDIRLTIEHNGTLTIPGNIDLSSSGTILNIGAVGNDFGAAQLDLAAGYTVLGANGLTISTTAGDLTLDPAGVVAIHSTSDLFLTDDVQLRLGAAPDFWLHYDSGNTRLALTSTNIGAGVDGDIFRIDDGQEEVDFADAVNAGAYDEYDDAMVLFRAFSPAVIGRRALREHRQELIDMGVLRQHGDGWVGASLGRMSALLAGGVYQTRFALDDFRSTVEERLEAVEEANRILQEQLATAGVLPGA